MMSLAFAFKVTISYISGVKCILKWRFPYHWIVKWSLCAMTVLIWGGPSAFGIYMFSLCTGISLYFVIEQWRYLPVLWQWYGGVHLPLVSICFLYALVFPYIFFIEQWRDHCAGGVHLPLVSICLLYALVFPYIFLLFDCFE